MVLPSSGSIGCQQIETEFGIGTSITKALSNDLGTYITQLPGATTSMSSFYGKSNQGYKVVGYAWQGGSTGNTSGLDGAQVYFYTTGSTNATVRVVVNGTNPTAGNYLSFYLSNGVYNTPRIYVRLSQPYTGTVAMQSQAGNTTAGAWTTRTTLALTNAYSFYIAALV
jgi:hypothetical protein